MVKLFVILPTIVLVSYLAQCHGGKADKPAAGAKPGAKLSARKPVDDKVKALVEQVEPEMKEKICGITPSLCGVDAPITVTAYKKQVVTGTNYFVAVALKNNYYHARIYEQTWTDTVELVDVIGPKGQKDDIRYF